MDATDEVDDEDPTTHGNDGVIVLMIFFDAFSGLLDSDSVGSSLCKNEHPKGGLICCDV